MSLKIFARNRSSGDIFANLRNSCSTLPAPNPSPEARLLALVLAALEFELPPGFTAVGVR
jgi:hypothetical protein